MSEQLPLSHPFDREEEASLQQLFTAFCNHLTLGQWELARVCLRGLFKQRHKLDKPLKEILRAIIDQPHHASYGSWSVPSPFHLSWLCLVEYLDLFTDEEDQIPEPIVKKVEFRLLLHFACRHAPQVVIQDIDDYHSQIVYRDPDLFASGVSDLPSSTLSYLKQLLSESPQFGQALINDLTSKGKGFLKNNQLLQQLYLDLINEQLMALDSEAVEVDGLSCSSVSENDSSVKCATKQCKFIYQMLAYMDPSPEMLSLSKCLDDLFRDLITRSANRKDSVLDRGTLYSCFLSQSSTYLIEKFCFIENQMRFVISNLPELPLSRTTPQRFKQPPTLDGLSVHVCYAQSFMEDRREAWKFLFFHALNGNHILENIVETALVFIRESDFAKLTQLLSPVEFSRLKPLVLLLGWPFCYSCENAKNLLEALWNPMEKAAHPSLHQACQKLAYQVQLVQWCTEKARPLLASSEPGSTRHQQASEMFQGLESHSVLHVLHKSISLAHLPEKEVFELLRKRPVFTPLKEDVNGPSGEGSEERLDAKQAGGESEEVNQEDLDQNSEIHPEVQRDIFLYHSYCALRNFMEAVTSSVETSGELSLETKQGKTAESFNSGGSEYSDMNSEEICQEERYCGQVRNKLEAGKYHLTQVYPLTYRVEILENIFSLLFATYEDLYEGRTQHNESDDVEAMDDETRSLSKSSRTGSWESLASSLDLSFDVHGPHTPLKDQEKAASLTGSLPPTPHTQKQKSPPALSAMDSPSRRQLFKNNRAESDSALLKKSLDGDETIAPPVFPPASNTVKAKLSEEESYSGNLFSSKGSSRTVVAEENDLKYEFVIEDAIVPDMLTTLKECLMELNTAKFNELKKEKSESFVRRQDFLQTSVPRNSMEQRISRLGQFINEAQWRFQLVSWKNASKGQTARNSKKRLSRKIKQIVRTDGKSREEDAEDEDSDDVDGAIMSRISGQKAAASKENSGESSAHLSQDISTGTDDNREVTRKRKSRHRRLTSRTSGSEGCTLLIKDDSVIARMLSSPDTLIYMCMRKDNYERALQVIKMFNMAEKPSAQAAVFAEKYSKIVKHLESLQPKGRRVKTQGLLKSRKPLGGLGAVAMAAASGASSSVVSNLIDELLAMPSLSAVLDLSLTPEDLANGNSTLVKFLDPEMIPTMLCVDLASTTAVSWSVCKTLLEMGKSRITEGPYPSSSKSSGLLPGIKPFMYQLEELLDQEMSRGNARAPSGGIAISVTPKPNAMDLLLVGTHPIRPKDMEAHRKLISSQEESFRRFEQALDEGETQISSVDEVAKQPPGHRHVGRQASFNLMETGLAVRVAMIELKKAFDCTDSANYVTTADGGGLEQRYDYISSLIKHVETLATLLLFWKSKAGDASSSVPPDIDLNRPGALKVSNPFVVLNESIAEALGRPMFERNIPPNSLEAVARQLHVNLSKVIVYNCCPSVPSHGGTSCRDVRWPSSDLVVLNTGSRWTENVRDPNTVSNDLLSRMVKLLKDLAEKNGGEVDSNLVANITRTPEFQAISRGTAELQCVDLNLLTSDTAKVCFYLNTVNLLIAHASLIQFADSSGDGKSEVERSITRHASFSRLMDAMSSSGGEGKGGDAVPLTALERIAFLKQQCYCIGQLGVVSAFDLQFVILHKGLVPPSTFGEGVIMCFPERFTDDAKKYKLTTPERRVVFAICDGCISSPQLQIFDVDELDAQLSTAVVSYINSRVSLNQQTGQITLPEILHWYRKDFEIKAVDDFSSASGAAPDVTLLLQMEPYLFPDTAAVLQQMLPNVTEITFTPFCWNFGYRFDSMLRERSSSVSSLQRSNSLPENLLLSMELSVLAKTRGVGKRGLFSLNETALEYLEEKSPLAAALTSLVCSSPAKLNILTEDRPQFSKETLDSANETAEFPFRVALEKTAKFPCLQRYIASKLYTIADMLTLSPADSDEQGGSFGSDDFIKLDLNLQTLQDGKRPPEISLFSVALASEGSRALQNAILKASDFFLRKGYFEELLELICSSDLRGDGVAGPSIDFLLSSAVLSKGGTRSNLRKKLEIICNQLEIPDLKFGHVFHKKLWILLTRLKDHDELTRLVLRKIKEWKADTCIDLIDLCLSRSVDNAARRKDLERKRKEISLHQRISLCVKPFKLQAPAEERASPSASLKCWQGVASLSEENPSLVMEFLLSAQQFDLASEWAQLHNLPPNFHKVITESHLKFLLGNNPEEQMKAYKILEGLQDPEMSQDICESLLAQNLHVSRTLFIIQFMLTNIPSLLSPVRVEKLLCTKMGAKALLCLPDSARPHYEHLVSRPPLLLEQLLMNMKVEWAAKVFKRIQVDLSCMEDVESLGDHGCTVKAFDELLTTYSAKALEFQVVQSEESQIKEMCSSIMQSLIQAPSSSPTTSVGFLESGRYTPVTSIFGTRDTPVGNAERKVQTVPRRKISHEPRSVTLQKQTASPRTTGSLGTRRTAVFGGQQRYIPPVVPPKMEDWMPDQEVSLCVICQERFSMFNRRHHCRRCGRVVCGSCSQHSHVVDGYGKNSVRVCSVCHEYFFTSSSSQEDLSTSVRSESASFGLARASQGIAENTADSGPDSVSRSYLEETTSLDYLTEDMNARCLWKLGLDEETNSSLRDEFYYEQAPSASLCVSILDLHSDVKACGKLILDLCNSLSQKLVPVAPGISNEELDPYLLISMMRYLLFNAKLKMMKAGETQGVELCDTYLGHVDLMKFLVESNCGDIPSLRDLMRHDSARRLRDRFIEAERLSLAMEVSTKCGLDPSGVWGAAGFALLQAGDFSGAREKFSRCMKPEEGGKQQQQHNSQYLEKIVDILQSSPLLAYRQSTDDLMSPLLGLLEHSRNFQSGNSYLDPKRFEECLYYLHKYGSPSSLVAFYVRHGHLKLACRYILDQQCSVEVFIESLFMRLVIKGKFAPLKEQMEITDSTLQAWMPYLTAACKFLLRRSFHNLLYEVQVFMRDFFRAAQTCIRFYEGVAGGPVTSYEDLYSRMHYLEEAKQHIETVIAEKKSPKGTVNTVFAYLRQRSTGSVKSLTEEPSHLAMSLSELNSHLNTINLQIEVTNFMHQCAVDRGGLGLLRASEGSRLPTLFGNGHIRGDMVVQVLLAGTTIQNGFSLASRIIQDYNLPAARVYVDAGRSLARQYKYPLIEELLRCSGETGQVTDKCHDDIILACVSIVAADQSQAKYLEGLIKHLKSEINKISAFIMCGKLKSAYLIAVKGVRVDAIREIADVAEKSGQSKMVEICRKYLTQFEKQKAAQRKHGAESNR